MQVQSLTLNFTRGPVKRPYEILGIKFLWAGYKGRTGYHLVPYLFQSIKQVERGGAELHAPILFIPQVRGRGRFFRNQPNFIKRKTINQAARLDVALPYYQVGHYTKRGATSLI